MPGEDPGPDQIVSSNGIGAEGDARGRRRRGAGCCRSPATPPRACAALRRCADGADLIVTLGGASVGDFDLVQQTALAHGLDARLLPGRHAAGKAADGRPPRRRAADRPARQSGLGAWSAARSSSCPAVERMLGLAGRSARRRSRPGSAPTLGPNGPRTHYMRARVERGRAAAGAAPPSRQDSSLLSVLRRGQRADVRARRRSGATQRRHG